MGKKFLSIMLGLGLVVVMFVIIFGDAGTTPSIPVRSVSVGWRHTAALTESGEVWTWGYNSSGQLGDGTFNSRSIPVRIMDNVRQVHAGWDNTMAVTENGELWMWGMDIEVWMWSIGIHPGDGINEYNAIPAKIMDNIRYVSSSGEHIMAITNDGELWTWGDNQHGQLGDGTTERTSLPMKIKENVRSVSAGGGRTMAITEDGVLWGWGRNDHGQLGDGTGNGSLVPVRIMENVRFVSAGSTHTMAITEDGELWGWGSAWLGHTYDGAVGSTIPVKIMDNVRYVSTNRGIFPDQEYTMAITKKWGVVGLG